MAAEADITLTLVIFTVLTAFSTLYNLYALRKSFSFKQVETMNASLIEQAELGGQKQTTDEDKSNIEKWYLRITLVPLVTCFFSCIAGARPGAGLWIIPLINLVGGLTYVIFIRLVIRGCGEDFLKATLTPKPDECKWSRVFCMCLRANQWKGLRYRIGWCAIILMKPALGYFDAIMKTSIHGWRSSAGSVLVILLNIFCTLVPIQMLRIIIESVKMYCRIALVTRKGIFINLMIPILITQGIFFGILNSAGALDSLGNNADIHLQGIFTCIEMFLVSAAWQRYFFTLHDLDDWQPREDLP